MKTIIKVVCQTCGKFMYEKDGEGITGISHSSCEDCLRKLYSDVFTEEEIQEIVKGGK
jgi:hypothetical protein